jgi:archaellum component FlaC
MMSIRLKSGLVVVMLCFATPALASECENIPQASQSKGLKFGKDTQKTTGFGAVVGGLLGGVIGLVTAGEEENESGETKKDKAKSAAQGAAIGAALGGVAGVGVGQVAEGRRAKFKNQSAYLDCEIESAQKAIEQRNQEIETAKKQYDAVVTEIAALNAKASARKTYRRELTALRGRLANQIAGYEMQLAGMLREIERFDGVTKNQAAVTKKASGAVIRKRQQLAQQLGELQSRYNQIARIKDDTVLAANSLKKGAA